MFDHVAGIVAVEVAESTLNAVAGSSKASQALMLEEVLSLQVE